MYFCIINYHESYKNHHRENKSLGIKKMNNKQKNLVVVHGPTAVGKTAIAIELAKALGCEILSCDSRQFYRQMRIGTAVPSPEELSQVKHHFIQDRSIEEPISSGEYENEALALLEKVFEKSPYAVVVGGSGLYAAALTDGLDDLPRDSQLREELKTLSLEELQQKLEILDPEYYNTVELNNRRRVERAVEVSTICGVPYSTLRTGCPKQRPFTISEVALVRPREELYQRIDQRVDIMLEEGLESEVRSLLEHRELSALQTVGYREFFDYFDGKTDFEEAVRLIKRNSRRYAKRQMTWIRSRANVEYFDATGEDVAQKIADHVAQSN